MLKSLSVLLILSVSIVLVIDTPSTHAEACQASRAPSGAYVVTVCLGRPENGQTLTGVVSINTTVSVNVRNTGIQRVFYQVDGVYLLTDYQAPYEFFLPTYTLSNGRHNLSVQALTRDQFTTDALVVTFTTQNEVLQEPPLGQSQILSQPPVVSGRPIVVAATGDGASGEANSARVTDLIASWNPDLFLYLGDVYERGTYTEFYNWYGTSETLFGRLGRKTAPVVGNHEYSDSKPAPGYFGYWGDVPPYYSFDVGAWHFVALNSASESRLARVGSPQYLWLEQDLRMAKAPCTVVFFHHPVFSIGPHGATDYMNDFWPLFVKEGVDLVLTGHDHNYQHWLPLNESGDLDPKGLSQFVLGAGGHGVRQVTLKDPRVSLNFDRVPNAIGALRLELTDKAANFQYNNIAGVVLDSGSIPCRGRSEVSSGPSAAPASASLNTPQQTSAAKTEMQPSFPIRAAFYYGWYPQGWGPSNADTKYEPTLGKYDSMNAAVTKKHVEAMQYANIDAAIASWWGRGHVTDSQLPLLLSSSAQSTFRWSIYYEPEGQEDPNVSRLRSDLTYLRDKYGSNPNFLRIDGKFVVFVYADDKDDCGMASRWKEANTVGAYVVLKVFPGYKSCDSQPDSWHQYAPAKAVDSQASYSYTISPGFNKPGEQARLGRDIDRWRESIRSMVASDAEFQLITTFNEWIEGTSVESAAEWGSPTGHGLYLDALHELIPDEKDEFESENVSEEFTQHSWRFVAIILASVSLVAAFAFVYSWHRSGTADRD